MSHEREFLQLSRAARIGHDKFPFLLVVSELHDKRQHVAMYQADIPGLVKAYQERRREPHRDDPRVLEHDPMPGLRLAAACEGLANAVYAACEIAAIFANKATGQVPSSFNKFRKKVKEGKLSADLIGDVKEFDSYERIHELRTEWTHYSTIFIAEDNDGSPLLVAKPLRRDSNRVVLPDKALLRVDQLTDWSGRAIFALDRFALRVYERFVLPHVNLDREFFLPARDSDGFPTLTEDGRMEGEKVTVRDYLRNAGFEVD